MTQTVTIAFSVYGYENASVWFPWIRGKKLRDYLREPQVKKYALVQQALTNGAKNESGQKIKLTKPLEPGSVVIVGGAW
jgi:hypothetical protein